MGLEQFYVKEKGDTLIKYLPESERWFVKVRALNGRERKERDQIMVRENIRRPRNERAQKQLQEGDFQETSIEYMVAKLRDYEYNTCIVDFILPYLPEGANTPVDFTKSGKSRDDVREFYDKLPAPLGTFIEDAISEVNKEGKYAQEAEEVKND